jgi:hypothetical protein
MHQKIFYPFIDLLLIMMYFLSFTLFLFHEGPGHKENSV